MSDNITPEEKLLRLIKTNKNPQPEKIHQKSLDKTLLHKHLTPVFIENIIISIILILICYLIVSYIYPFVGPKKFDLKLNLKSQLIAQDSGEESVSKSIDSYTQGIGKREIFKNLSVSPAGGGISLIAGTDVFRDLTLVGIISGQNPQAVIEDKKAQKTYYLGKGQFIGDYQVEDIQEGKIILRFNGRSFELTI